MSIFNKPIREIKSLNMVTRSVEWIILSYRFDPVTQLLKPMLVK